MKLRVALAAGALALAHSAGVMAAGDPAHGEQVYARCVACHALAQDRVGPRHCGVVGRRAAGVAGFLYSDAMRESRLTWDEKTLDRFLARPMAVVPGTTMTYDGVPDAKDRADLIAYLSQAAARPECTRR